MPAFFGRLNVVSNYKPACLLKTCFVAIYDIAGSNAEDSTCKLSKTGTTSCFNKVGFVLIVEVLVKLSDEIHAGKLGHVSKSTTGKFVYC